MSFGSGKGKTLILFVHIPKTAGTSFCRGISQVLPPNSMFLDYGPDGPQTDATLRALYGQKECTTERIAKVAAEKEVQLIGGHFPLGRHIRSFPSASVITFVREPLQRCYSEFLHQRRHNGYTGSFLRFIQRPGQINIQSQWLQGMPENGIVGISEYYSASLKVINEQLGLFIPHLRLNCHRLKLKQRYGNDLIPNDHAEKFYELNKDDVVFYDKCLKSFEAKNISLVSKGDYLLSTTLYCIRQGFKKIRGKINLNSTPSPHN